MSDPITPISLENAEGRKAAFMPQSDMTALESALLTQLFVKMILNRSGQPLDWEGYVAGHKLGRHFALTGPAATDAYNWKAEAGDPRTKTIVAERDMLGVTKGTKLQVLADMPVLDGWVEEKGEAA